jgi:hypothetical protein
MDQLMGVQAQSLILDHIVSVGIPTNGQLLIGNGTNYTLSTITGTPSNIIVSDAAGSITLNLATVGTAGTYRSVTTDLYGRITSGTNPTTLSGYGITDAAPIASAYVTIGNDALLTNERSLTGTVNEITLTDGGVNSTVTLSIANNPILPGTGSVTLPIGTTAQQPGSPTTGMVRFNTNVNYPESYNGTYWSRFGGVKQYLSGNIVQSSGTTLIAFGNTAPLSTDGTQIFSQVITPLSITNSVTIEFSIMVDVANNNNGIAVSLWRGTTLLDVKATWISIAGNIQTLSVIYVDVPGTTTATTYSARIGASSATTWYCNQGSAATFGGAIHSTYTIKELG